MVVPHSVAGSIRVENIMNDIGFWFVAKYRGLAVRVGTQQAARNMRKQGVPLEIALAVLARGAK